MNEITHKDIENIIGDLNKLSQYVQILQTPDEYFHHMQGHQTELSLVLSAFSIAKYSEDIIKLLNQSIKFKNIKIYEVISEDKNLMDYIY